MEPYRSSTGAGMDRISLKIDLHVHTRFSNDAVNSFYDINAACRHLGLDGYAVCDHDTIEGLRAGKSEGLLVVPGLEVSARGAHVLCLDPVEVVPSGLSIVETVERIHVQGGTAVLAHPMALPKSFVSLRGASVAGFDAVEVANAAQFPFRLVMSWNRNLARRLGLPETGGSDAHSPETIGRSYTVVESDSRDPDDIIKAIKMGRTRVFGAGSTMVERFLRLRRFLSDEV
jgi:predicted metal-dependent phosphoesterase TrpH